MEFEKIASTSLTDSIYRTLLGKILSGAWKAGDRFPAERDIAEQMGVSRSSLHHAVLQLERDGFVCVLPRRGIQVNDYRNRPTPQCLSALMAYSSEELDEPLFRDMMDTGRWLESACARLACSRIREDTLLEMRALTESLAEEDDTVPERIYRFHSLLTQASGNSIFTMLFRAFEPVLMQFIRRHYSLRAIGLEETAAMQRELLEHIEAHDENAAAECLDRLLTRGIKVLESRYQGTE